MLLFFGGHAPQYSGVMPGYVLRDHSWWGKIHFLKCWGLNPAPLSARQALYLLYYLSGPSTKYFYRKKHAGVEVRESVGLESLPEKWKEQRLFNCLKSLLKMPSGHEEVAKWLGYMPKMHNTWLQFPAPHVYVGSSYGASSSMANVTQGCILGFFHWCQGGPVIPQNSCYCGSQKYSTRDQVHTERIHKCLIVQRKRCELDAIWGSQESTVAGLDHL